MSDRRNDEKPKKEKETENGERSRWPLYALAALIVVAVIGGVIYWFLTRNLVSTDDAYTDGRSILIAPNVAGYVVELAVDDNRFVHKGDLLVSIEAKDYAAARDQAAGQLAAVEAQLSDAEVALEKARITYPAQVAQAKGQVEQARGQQFQAQREYDRQHAVTRAATTEQVVDNSTAGLSIANGQLMQATAQLRQAELVDQNIAQAATQVKQLQGQVAQARAGLAQAEINLGYTKITAPQDGWVTKRNVEVGSLMAPGTQIMALVTPQFWVTANFKESQLNRMRPGQKVDILVDAYPDLKLEGHVDSIQLGSGARFTAFPPENATGNFVKVVQRVPVKIVIDRGLDPKLPLPLGMSVEPTVHLE